jgi:hypothetical protein
MHSQPRGPAICRMTLSPILWAGLGLACTVFSSPARAAAPEYSSSAPQNGESAADGPAPVRDAHIKSERPGDAQSPRTGEQPGAGSKVRNSSETPRPASETPQRGTQQGASGGVADRAHSSLMKSQARGHLARQTVRHLDSNRAATNGLAPPRAGSDALATPRAGNDTLAPPRAGNDGLAAPRAGNVGAAGAAFPAASKRSALSVPKLATAPRNSAIGGPRPQSAGRLDGAVMGRTNHSAAIDGTQFRPRF